MRRAFTTSLLALSALAGAMAEEGNSKHALDFLKMVEQQAMEHHQLGRNLQLGGLGSGKLVSGVSNTLSNVQNVQNPITGDSASQGAIGVGALVSAMTNPQAAVGNVINGGNGILGSNTAGGVGNGGLLNGGAANAVAGALGTVPTNGYKSPAGQPNAPGSVTPGAATNLPTAPDTCGNPMTIDVESFTEYRVFVDGNQVGYSNGAQHQRFQARYGSSGAVTIAVEATRDKDMPNFGLVDGLHINVTVCGQTYYSDQDWVCTDTRPWTHTWRLSSYTPFNWMQAALVADAETLVDGSKDFFIWSKPSCNAPTKGAPEAAFCRLKIKPGCKTHVPCYNEQSTSKPDTTCLSGCAMETAAMDKCSAMAHEISKKCGSCTPAYMTYYKQYCKTQGCSAEQCGLPAEPAFTPDASCLSACADGLRPLKSQCEQQAYVFQSGCAARCGPETMAYTRDQCLATYKCDPTQCSTFKENAAQNGGLANQPSGGSGGSGGGVGPAPGYTPPPTPDMTCFFRCLPGMNKLPTYCEKIQYALTSNCHSCPPDIIDWAKGACLDYQDPDGNKCTPQQCAAA